MIEKALEDLRKRFGKESVHRFGDKPIVDIEVIPTGCLSLDTALGVGGIPRGRIVEIYGAESSGKTSIALHLIVEAQKMGLNCAFVDVEYALDPKYVQALGVNLEKLIISQPSSAEEAWEIIEALIQTGEIGLIILDSLAAMVPQAEINGEFGDAIMGVNARLNGQAMRKLTGPLSKTNCSLFIINQTRQKLGIVYGSNLAVPGGNAVKFYASQRMEIARIAQLKQGEDVIGNRTKVKVIKNKVAPPFLQCEFDIMYGEGISKSGDLLDIAVEKGVIKKSGAWFSYNDANLGQGREKVKEVLVGELYEEIKNKCLK